MKLHENDKKNRQSTLVKTAADKQKSKLFKIIIVFFAILFLVYNLIFSQTISPIYFSMMENDQKAAVNFLEKIKFFPEYKNVLKMNSAVYGRPLVDKIKTKDNQTKTLIGSLEQILIYNQKERDILYSLYQLYSLEGKPTTADQYLQSAKTVDPNIK